jgi:hypothetical protein
MGGNIISGSERNTWLGCISSTLSKPRKSALRPVHIYELKTGGHTRSAEIELIAGNAFVSVL